MSELSKLLTFMFKEDRSEIIKQYNDMLDNAEDEQAMLESFGSPTRLAVAISRNYQRDERKLSVHADSKDGESAEGVKVKPVIPAAGKKTSAPLVKPNEPDQDAYVDIIEEIRREKAAEEGIEYKPIFFKEEQKPAEEEAPADEVEEAAPVEEETPTEEAPVDEAKDDAAPEEASVEEKIESAESAEPAEEEAPAEEVKTEDEAKTEEAAPAEEAEAEAPEDEAPAEPKDATAHMLETVFDEKPDTEVKTVKKTNVFLLILYVIVSVPVGLVLLLLMLGIELGIFCTGVLALRMGFELIGFTFSGMAVFADVLMCFGVTLGALALGILVTWLGLWLIITSVPGLIRGIVKLGKKLCVKEVETDE